MFWTWLYCLLLGFTLPMWSGPELGWVFKEQFQQSINVLSAVQQWIQILDSETNMRIYLFLFPALLKLFSCLVFQHRLRQWMSSLKSHSFLGDPVKKIRFSTWFIYGGTLNLINIKTTVRLKLGVEIVQWTSNTLVTNTICFNTFPIRYGPHYMFNKYWF